MPEVQIPVPSVPIIDEKTGQVTREWRWFFHDILVRIGGLGEITGLFTSDIGVTVQADLDLMSQAEAEAGTATTERVVNALLIAQAIAALESAETFLSIVQDLTPQLGDDLDVNGQSIVSASDGDIPITPDGTGDVILDGLKWPQADGTNTQIMETDGSGQLSFVDKPAGSGDSLPIVDTTNIVKGSADATAQVRIEADGITTGTTRVITMADQNIDLTPGTGSFATEAEGTLAASAMQDLADDATPQLGGDLDLDGNSIVSASGGDIPITPDTTGDVILDGLKWPQADGAADEVIKTDGAGQLAFVAQSGGGPTLGTEQAASGTSVDFTGIPAGTKRIVVQFVGVSQDGTAQTMIVQLGDSGGIETTGYLGSVTLILDATPSTVNTTTGLPAATGLGGGGVSHGTVTLTLEDAANFTWVSSSILGHSNTNATHLAAGSKSLSAELTQLRITTVGGSAEFDAGAFNILYE